MSEKAFTIRCLCNNCNVEIPFEKAIIGEHGEYCSKECEESHEAEFETCAFCGEGDGDAELEGKPICFECFEEYGD